MLAPENGAARVHERAAPWRLKKYLGHHSTYDPLETHFEGNDRDEAENQFETPDGGGSRKHCGDVATIDERSDGTESERRAASERNCADASGIRSAHGRRSHAHRAL